MQGCLGMWVVALTPGTGCHSVTFMIIPFFIDVCARWRVAETIPQFLPVQSGEGAGPVFLPRYSIREMESVLVLELCLPDSALVEHVPLCSYQLRAHCDVIYSSLVFLCMATLHIAKEDTRSMRS